MCSRPSRTWLERFGLADPSLPDEPGVPPFTGGLIGFFGYDLAPRLERLPDGPPRDSRLPDIRFGLYDTAVTVDHETGSVDLWAFDFLGEGDGQRDRRLAAWRRALEAPRAPRRPRRSLLGPVRHEVSHAAYLDSVGRVLEYIAAGDVFQVNLSQRFVARGRPDPLDLFLRLRSRSPAPFSAFLRWDDLAVLSASPEWFYQTRGDILVTRPIKGTRPPRAHGRRGRAAGRGARRQPQGPRRADDDRRPRAERPGPGLPLRDGPRHRCAHG